MTLYSFIKLCLLRAFSRLLLNLLVICTVITTLLTRMSLTLIQVGYISHYSLTWSSRRYGDVSRRDSRIFFLQPNKGGSIHVNLGIWCQFYSNKLVETKRKGKKIYSALIQAAPSTCLIIPWLSICLLSCNIILLPDIFKDLWKTPIIGEIPYEACRSYRRQGCH